MQVALNTLLWAGELGIITLGFSLSYAILRFVNFAHVEFVTAGAYFAWAAYRLVGMPLLLAGALSIVSIGLLASIIDLAVFRRLRAASAASKMIASVGVSIVIRMVVQVLFSGQAQSFGLSWPLFSTMLGVRLTVLQVLIIGLTICSMLLFHLMLSRTRIGRALRATADDFSLAGARGVNAPRMITLMWLISGSFAALGGIMLGLETQLRPGMGLSVLIPMFSAVTVGGLGNVYGAIAGALCLALAQNAILAVNFGALLGFRSGGWVPTYYKDVVALLALILTLLVRPRGIFALKESGDV